MSEKEHYPIIISGSGIAGLSAAVYTERGGNNTLVIEGDEPGGQLTLTTEVANYPGFPNTVGGTELVDKIKEQSKKFGTEFKNGLVENVEKTDENFTVNLSDGTKYKCDAFISASGASARTLGIKGEDKMMGYGVSTCATCDGAFFKGEDMAVVGGGDAAFEEAVFLTKFANKVYIIHRREGLRAEEHLRKQVESKVESGEIEMILNTEVTEIIGDKENGLNKVKIASNPDGHPSEKLEKNKTKISDLDIGALFIAIGHEPNTNYLNDIGVNLDSRGYIQLDSESKFETETNVRGLFAAGDVSDDHYQQAATAAGSGVKSAMDANDYIDQLD